MSYDLHAPRGDFFGGLTSTIVALPVALGFGVASGLGAAAGLYGAIGPDGTQGRADGSRRRRPTPVTRRARRRSGP